MSIVAVAKYFDEIFPDYVFRYYRADAILIDSIVNGYIYFPNPNTFNDPFDTKLPISTTGLVFEDFQRFLSQIDVSKRYSQKEIDQESLRMFQNPGYATNVLNQVAQFYLNTIGVGCFSTLNDNLLMWSHYGDKHRGLCIKYDLKKIVSLPVTRPLIISYTKEYRGFNYIRDRQQIANAIIATKSEDWRYENEIRIISQVQGQNKIDKTAVLEVLFGCACTLEVVHQITKSFKTSGYNPRFRKALKDANSFAIKFNDLDA